ncbi:TauD/TfdA family dioxygenase [Rugamonas sp. CCM 8940]|uniref:TauD/TfdA family dioxygenase n=1 Tax=Rugamonas sp. CCM 8940 TaxID=2765359 RepID=UPI0018F64DF9|nr:TauD/TfdA family dioxygenase [Rugamonas sp. CCM 8940]MBJ7309593.1 TauD/TfdA family dioxygenase [Rugamonas sp. CCM 8940]
MNKTMRSPPSPLETAPIEPYGLLAQAGAGRDALQLDADWLAETTLEHRLLLLRGFDRLDQAGLTAFCARLGKLLSWNFGEVLDLRVHAEPKNYLFTEGNVPYHWDGAFAEVVPRFQVFQCLQSDGDGGQTTFCDTVGLLQRAAPAELDAWRQLTLAYRTDQLAHYGGAIERRLIDVHPLTGAPTIRFAEPLNEQSIKLNPLEVRLLGHSEDEQRRFLDDFIPRLYAAPFYYQHQWRAGDLLLTDNHALLHGRTVMGANVKRHLQRVHVI